MSPLPACSRERCAYAAHAYFMLLMIAAAISAFLPSGTPCVQSVAAATNVGRAAERTLRLVRPDGQDWGGVQRQPCSAASQPQREAQAHAWVATSGVDGVASPWQPQRQLEPGQSTHWHERVEGRFMKVS